MAPTPLIAHIGYPKAASTLMRYQLFKKHPDIEYLATKGTSEPLNDVIRWGITKQDTFTYDWESAQKTISSELAKESNAKVRVISSQEFAWPVNVDRAVVAQMLKEQFNPDKIIVCIRRQQSWFPSQYYEERKKGTFRLYSTTAPGLEKSSPVSLSEWYDIRKEIDPYQPLLSRLDYWPLLKHYCDLFGKERVGLFFFEDLVEDNIAFAKSLFEFMGVSKDNDVVMEALQKANARLQETELRAKEITERYPRLVKVGRFVPFKEKVLDSRIFAKMFLFRSSEPEDMQLREDQLSHLRQICAEGNQAIADYFGVDLAGKGYFT